jgi:predicted  nucleic acid-binding Zn-ribbon protein
MTRWDSLLAVQEHDTALDQLHHQIETLPERADLAATMDQLAELERVGTEVTDERERIGRDQQRLEDEITTLTDKATNTDKRLYGGTVSNPRELQAMQDEIAALKRRIGQLEDRELELMEAAEPLDARLVEIIQKREAFDAEASTLRVAIAEAEVSLGAEVARVQAERSELTSAIDPTVLTEYESLRPRLDGIAIARLVGTQCGGCHLTLSAVEIDRIKRLPPDEPVRCEECGRLLAR